MSRKTINEWEKLQIQKIQLKADADARIRALDGHIDYLQDNMGRLLMGTAVTSVQSKMPPFVQNLFPLFTGSGSDKDQQSQYPAHQSSKTGAVVNQIIELLPIFFRGTKPVIIAFILKKAKDLIFSKKKKS